MQTVTDVFLFASTKCVSAESLNLGYQAFVVYMSDRVERNALADRSLFAKKPFDSLSNGVGELEHFQTMNWGIQLLVRRDLEHGNTVVNLYEIHVP